MKWCVVGYDLESKRYDFLTEWMKSKGIQNELEMVEISPSEFNQKFPLLRDQFDQIRIERPFRNESFLESKKNEAGMILLRTADCYFKDKKGNWWLRSALYEGIINVLSRQQQNMELGGSVLIVGAGGGARAAIAALVKVGFQTFNITNAFDDQATELISELRKIYFNVKFQFISQSQLVLLPGTNSIVVNTTPLIETNEILDELHYFNFLIPQGLVWDFTIYPIDTPLTKEATEIGAKIFRGYEFAAASDWVWLRWVQPSVHLSEEDCREALKAHFQ